MTDSDDDISGSNDDVFASLSQVDETATPPEKLPQNSADDKSYSDKTQQVRLPTNLQEIAQMKNHLRDRLKGTDIDETLSLRIVKAALLHQENNLEMKKKLGAKKGRPSKPVATRDAICKMFSIGNSQYSQIIHNYFASNKKRKAYATGKEGSGRSGNRATKATVIPRTKCNYIKLRDFVRDCLIKRQRVTARQVLDFLVDEKILHIPRDSEGRYDKQKFAAANRIVHRFVRSCGFRRGRRTGNIVQKESVIVHRNIFLREFFHNRQLPPNERLREVMMDESYIHHHYHKFDDSIFDPSDNQGVQVINAPPKGRSSCFAAAIQGPDPRVESPTCSEEKAGLVSGSFWRFCPQQPKQHIRDYHKVFDGENFVNWWKTRLLPNLRQPSLIMLDSAKYHLVKGSHVPNVGKMKKEELQEYLQLKEVIFDARLSVVELRSLAKEWIKQNEKAEIVNLAEAEGHKVLFYPPYHSELQPIELVWALVKGNVSRQYTKETTLKDVLQRLDAEFEKLQLSGHASIQGMIESCAATAKKIYDEMELDDDDGNDDGEETEEDGSDHESVVDRAEYEAEEEWMGDVGDMAQK